MLQRILNLFKRTPNSEPVESFIFPSGNSSIRFSEGWEMLTAKKGESTFTFFNDDIDGILYASEQTNIIPSYKYKNETSLEIHKDYNPKIIEISQYDAVHFSKPDEQANVIYKYYEIGYNKTLLQFTWMTPEPDNTRFNQEIERILGSTEIN